MAPERAVDLRKQRQIARAARRYRRLMNVTGEVYRYDVVFYMGVTADEVQPFIVVNPEVDEALIGPRAVYHRRIAALATRSRLNKIIGSPVYSALTIRNWNTTVKLAAMLDE